MKNETILLILIPVSQTETRAGECGCGVRSRASTGSFRDGWDRIFQKKEAERNLDVN